MNFIKNLWNKIKAPHGWRLILFYLMFAVVLAATLTLVFCKLSNNISYILYGVSAIMLAYFVYTIVYLTPKIRLKIIGLMQKHKFTQSLLKDYGYRTIVFSMFTFILNLAYVTLVAIMAIMSRTAWYFSILVYYIALTLMKGNVFYSKRKYSTEIKEARAYRFCGIMFIVMTIAFSGVIVLIYKQNHYFEYAGLLIYAAATFTFYKLSLAIYNIYKARKQNSLYIQSIRNINFASALISMIVLQVAMFQAFSPENNTGLANALTGAGVSIIILILGIFMIIKANKIIKELSKSNDKQIQI